jgi:hypothetical protein
MTAPYSITFRIPVVTPLLNEVEHMHHFGRAKLLARFAWHVRVATAGRRPAAPLQRARVTIERCSVGTPDRDNLVGGVKRLVDVLLTPLPQVMKRTGKLRVRHKHGLGFLVDDAPTHLDLEVKATRVAHKADQGTVVTIEELPAAT